MPAGDARGGDAQGVLLRGLDGSNPLGFLAAVGTLRTVGLAEPDADWRMKWLMHDGIQIPAIRGNRAVSAEALVALLCRALRRKSTPELDFGENLNVKPENPIVAEIGRSVITPIKPEAGSGKNPSFPRKRESRGFRDRSGFPLSRE